MDKLKQSLYFPKEMLEEIKKEAERLDRSLSWVVQRAWKIAKQQVQDIPGEPDLPQPEIPGEALEVLKGPS